ncbi:deoxyribodipyrimidine photo-lyase [Antarcticirhabdus aurantiaca]|uniref:Deoxyribodipyrimidine photo-lyase n=1 Tax=Antarcticirhabdus aurantiaca TaxID=2606717 RepID=A0ACD4NLI9_9HYPH|nr:deoxyribodipyrimidine photo-lyase [Antarcticirhabdus aurantiaca]WAJ27638.1 deoxyribodipyrimidine photo-lyase [Jeongeuplla avenae]
MIEPQRIQTLKDAPVREDGTYVLYWMQQSQRARFNPALELAVREANELGLPVLVCFGVTGFPEANARHYDFMLQGLAEVEAALDARGIPFLIAESPPNDLALALSGKAALTVCDRGYLAVQRQWRDTLASRIDCRLVQVEGDVVVPVETASAKHEYAARTLRPKIVRLRDAFIAELRSGPVTVKAALSDLALPRHPERLDLSKIPAILDRLKLDRAVGPIRRFAGGEGAARKRLKAFLDKALPTYSDGRNKPEASVASHLSPYLHFGQISPAEIALAARKAGENGDNTAAFLEELIVRRELAMNHVFFSEGYDSYAALPAWARETLETHAGDERPHLYTKAQFEAGETHDRYWNAAMLEMRATGYMHNHLRMYWGKKVLHWSKGPEEAFETLLSLNNRWFIDGRDANSFTNVSWVFGLHDRPWGRQPVFGTVRTMGPNTFRKFDADAYVKTVERLAEAEE